jgi:Family of unknown function (DUF6112)
VAGQLSDLALGFAVSLKPDPTALPGTSLGQRALGGLVSFAMIFFAIVLIVGAAQWAWSGSNNNPVGASAGKRKVGLALAGFFLIGGGEAILTFAQKMGESLK